MELKVPEEIILFGMHYGVVLRRLDNCENSAECDSTAREIRIDESSPPVAQVDLLIHEVIEAINDNLELGLEHPKICAISVGVHDFIVNNLDRMVSDERPDNSD